MPYKDPVKAKEAYRRSYLKNREKNREKCIERSRLWHKENRERSLSSQRERDRIRQNDPERVKYVEQWKIENPESAKISSWKHQGMKLRPDEDWISIWVIYELCENCEICNVKLTRDKQNKSTTKCLDHDHDTGLIRHIICHKCNVGK